MDSRYYSKSTAPRVTKTSALVTFRYTNPAADLAKHIYSMAALLEQFRSMDFKMDGSPAVVILVAFID